MIGQADGQDPNDPRVADLPARFGCARCYGEDAHAAWGHYTEHLEIRHMVVDEPHFIVQVRRCTACSQPFVWVLQEHVDWVAGNDAQYRDVVPVTPEEADVLVQQGEDLDLRELMTLGRSRRHLQADWPSDADAATIRWVTGELRVSRLS
jgi:hypothetical protein